MNENKTVGEHERAAQTKGVGNILYCNVNCLATNTFSVVINTLLSLVAQRLYFP